MFVAHIWIEWLVTVVFVFVGCNDIGDLHYYLLYKHVVTGVINIFAFVVGHCLMAYTMEVYKHQKQRESKGYEPI